MLKKDLDRFYRLLNALEADPGQGRRLGDCASGSCWPMRGVYFFREAGEYRQGSLKVPRIVRVGTHAVSTGSKSTLWARLRHHRGARNGGGNHRGSIFRQHVGAALLRKSGAEMEALPTWGVGSSASNSIRLREADHERQVSAHLGNMTVLWIEVPDEPGPDSDRALIERNAIALLSNQRHPLDRPSRKWLGRHSPRQEICSSGLWNLNHLNLQYTPDFLKILNDYVKRTLARKTTVNL